MPKPPTFDLWTIIIVLIIRKYEVTRKNVPAGNYYELLLSFTSSELIWLPDKPS